MKISKWMTGLLMIIMVFLLSSCSKGKLTLKADTFQVELGEAMSEDISVYADAKESVLNQCELNIEEVDPFNIGTYKGKIIYDQKEYPFTVEVKDTIAPQAELRQTVFNLEVDESIDISEILGDIKDADEVTVTFKYNDLVLEEEEIMFDDPGEYDVIVELSDTSKNVSTYEFRVNVTELSIPVIEGLTKMTIRPGDHPDYLAGVTATDAKDGDLTDQIEVDASEVDMSEDGEYEVYYFVSDSDDNYAEESRIVIVKGNPEEKEEEEPEEIEEEEPEEPEDTTIPEITGAKNITISLGGALPNLLEGVTAYDAKDGDLTSAIQVDDSMVNINEAGEYEVYYFVIDQDGNENGVTIILTVTE